MDSSPTVINGILDLIVKINLEGVLEYITPSVENLLGYKPEAALGKSIFEFIHPEDQERVRNAIDDAQRTQTSKKTDCRLRHANGSYIWFEGIGQWIKNQEGTLAGAIISVRNISTRIVFEEALRQRERENAVIAEIGRIISSDLNIESIYIKFAEEANELLPFDRIAINIIEPDEKAILIVYTSGIEIPGRHPGDRLPLANSVNELLLSNPFPLLIQTEDEEQVKSCYPSLYSTFLAGFRSMLSVPLISKGKVFGALHLRAFKPNAYNPKDLDTAERIGAQIAGAVANALLFKNLDQAEKNLRYLSGQLLTAQEDERRRIAAEIHDGLTSTMSSIYLRLDAILRRSDREAEENASLQDILALIKGCIEDSRRIQINLRPPLIDNLGILPTIHWFIREHEKAHSEIRIEGSFQIQETEIPDPLKIVIFRILQEGLHNSAKHSGANLVQVSLKNMGGQIELRIRDNGRGFDPAEALSRQWKGLGISSMKERTKLSGGTFSLEAAIGAGTAVRASWPIE